MKYTNDDPQPQSGYYNCATDLVLKYTKGSVRIEVMNALGGLHANDAMEPLFQMLEKANEEK